MSKLKKALAGTLAIVLGAAFAPFSPAQAQDRPEDQGTPTMVMLDNSGSMNENDAGGQSRINAAKDAATTLIDDIADSTDLGLTYYGGNTSEGMADYQRGCQDVSVVRSPERGSTEELTDAIDELQPFGFTPIGKALTDSADELSTGGTIVLVSDGLANCTPPDVCDVAEDLADSGIDLVINTIGFNVETDAREELECIAEAGNGTYTDANDANSLTEALKRATTRQYAAYQSEAEEINGSEDRYNTPEIPRDVTTFQTLTPPTEDSGTTQSDSSSIFWRVPVDQGERLTIALNSVIEPNLESIGEGRLHYTLRLHPDIEGRSVSTSGRCGNQARTLDTNIFHGPQSAHVMSREIGTDRCDTDEMILELVRRGDYRDGEDITNEITVKRFGKVDASTTIAAVDENEVGFPEAVSMEPETITPGSWFDDAAGLDPEGQKVTTNIVPGETHFYKIPAG